MNTTAENTTEPQAAILDWMKRHSVSVQFQSSGIDYTNDSGLTARFKYSAIVSRGGKNESFNYSGGSHAFLNDESKKELKKQADRLMRPGSSTASMTDGRALASILNSYGNRLKDMPETRAAYRMLYTESKPEAESLLDCLKMDSIGPDIFEDWADELGYDKDSRAAERTFRECRDTARRLRELLGREAYAELLSLESL